MCPGYHIPSKYDGPLLMLVVLHRISFDIDLLQLHCWQKVQGVKVCLRSSVYQSLRSPYSSSPNPGAKVGHIILGEFFLALNATMVHSVRAENLLQLILHPQHVILPDQVSIIHQVH